MQLVCLRLLAWGRAVILHPEIVWETKGRYARTQQVDKKGSRFVCKRTKTKVTNKVMFIVYHRECEACLCGGIWGRGFGRNSKRASQVRSCVELVACRLAKGTSKRKLLVQPGEKKLMALGAERIIIMKKKGVL